MPTTNFDAADEAVETMLAARTILGRRYKQAVRDAWFDGNYRSRGLDHLSSPLQRARNNFGPTWLHNLRLPS